MSIAEKLTQIAKKQQRVYEAGYIRGRNSNAYDEGYTNCLKDVVMASTLPFFLTPFEARPQDTDSTAMEQNPNSPVKWQKSDGSVVGDVSFDNGVLYRRFRGKNKSSTVGISLKTIPDAEERTIRIIDGTYLVFKMRTNYGALPRTDFHCAIDCIYHKKHLNLVYPIKNFMPNEEWATYVMDISRVCSEYKKDDNGQYPIIRLAYIAFYNKENWDSDHTERYVDFAYSAVCENEEQVWALVGDDTCYEYDKDGKTWNKKEKNQ